MKNFKKQDNIAKVMLKRKKQSIFINIPRTRFIGLPNPHIRSRPEKFHARIRAGIPMIWVRGRDAISRGGFPFTLGGDSGRGVRSLEENGGRVVGAGGGGEGAEAMDYKRSGVRKACSVDKNGGGESHREKRK